MTVEQMTKERRLFDAEIVCPVSGRPLFVDQEGLVDENAERRYPSEGGVSFLYAAEEDDRPVAVTDAVREFYTEAPFPNYNDFDDVATFVKRAERSVFAAKLRSEIPINSKVLEVGCGTGQLSNFLAATTMSHIYATDLTPASLHLGAAFARRNHIHGIKFLQMNLFRPCIRPRSMDLVISNGVLHHTYDTRKAFRSIAGLVKPGGHILVGLYNKIGRLRTDFRRLLYKRFGESVLFLDPHLRNELSAEKRRAWIQDQYLHPQERKHTMSEVLRWFREDGFSFVTSLPAIGDAGQASGKLFTPHDQGTPLDRLTAQSGMLFSSLGGEGGLFIMIGRKS
jgi:2-polyprenyl-3-methyl-5-hydroxy-6-metoxy-1,4-benzoquinol methylase